MLPSRLFLSVRSRTSPFGFISGQIFSKILLRYCGHKKAANLFQTYCFIFYVEFLRARFLMGYYLTKYDPILSGIDSFYHLKLFCYRFKSKYGEHFQDLPLLLIDILCGERMNPGEKGLDDRL